VLKLGPAVTALEMPGDRCRRGQGRPAKLYLSRGQLIGVQARSSVFNGLRIKLPGLPADLDAKRMPGRVVIQTVGFRADLHAQSGAAVGLRCERPVHDYVQARSGVALEAAARSAQVRSGFRSG